MTTLFKYLERAHDSWDIGPAAETYLNGLCSNLDGSEVGDLDLESPEAFQCLCYLIPDLREASRHGAADLDAIWQDGCDALEVLEAILEGDYDDEPL